MVSVLEHGKGDAWVLVITPRRHDSGTINLGKGVLERITMVETCLGGGWKM